MTIYVETSNVLKEIKIVLQEWIKGSFAGEDHWSEDYSSDWYCYDENRVFTKEEFEDLKFFMDEKIEKLESDGREWRWDWEEVQTIDDKEWIEDIKNGIII